jgi:hypothetical protein
MTTFSGHPFAFSNAAPLETGTANLHDGARDAAAHKAGRSQFDPAYDAWFNTALFPTQAQAPFTLRNFPTMFSDVRSQILKRLGYVRVQGVSDQGEGTVAGVG